MSRQFLKLVFLIALPMVLLTGCFKDEPKNNTGHIGVVDIDRIAVVIGQENKIAASVEMFKKEQEAKLTKLRDDLRANYQAEEQKLGKKLKEKEKQALAELAERSDRNLNLEISKVKNSVEQLRLNLILEFKKEIQPMIRRAANKAGYKIIMIKQNTMVYIEPSLDITDAVIDEIQSVANRS